MKRPFLVGVLAGLLTPILFLGSVLFWIHRATGKIPFPAADDLDDQVTLKLIPPDQVPEAWAPWEEKLSSLVANLEALGDEQDEVVDVA